MPPEPPKRHQPANVDKVVGAGTDYARSQDHVRPELARKGTLPGGMAAIPAPPPLPPDLRPTTPAVAHTAPTQRAPTPATGIRIPSDETPVSGPPGATTEPDLRAALAAAERRNAELERRERVRVEAAGPNSWPPKVEQRKPSPVPSSSPEAKVDRAIGGTVRLLLARYGWPALAALGLGGAAMKPAADPAKADAAFAMLEQLTRKVDRIAAKQDAALDREPELLDFVECLYDQQREYFEQLLPSQERLVTGELRRSWVDRCRNRKPKR